MFKHFVITQFNLLQFPLGVDGNENWVNWTRRRIKLFQEFCLPSLLQQSNRNFIWLIYFDRKTPKEFNYLFQQLAQYDFVKPMFADGFNGFMQTYLHDIKSLSGNADWILTSRIDNDDSYHKDAVDVFQKHFVESDEHLISLASGYTLNTENYNLAQYYYPMSPFISMIERADKKEPKGIFFMGHSSWQVLHLSVWRQILRKNNKSTFIFDKPYWLQVIHGENVANSAKRGLPVLKEKSLSDFGLVKKSTKQSINTIFTYYDYWTWKLYFKSLMAKYLS